MRSTGGRAHRPVHPGFYSRNGWKNKTGKGFLVPVRDPNGRIQEFQVRSDAGEPKYYYYSSAGEPNGCSAKSLVHFVGNLQQNDWILTEGALKADVIHALTGFTVIALMGVSCSKSLLQHADLLAGKIIHVAYDMDSFTKPNVKKSEESLYDVLEQLPIDGYTRLMWDRHYKGLDDYLKKGL